MYILKKEFYKFHKNKTEIEIDIRSIYYAYIRDSDYAIEKY